MKVKSFTAYLLKHRGTSANNNNASNNKPLEVVSGAVLSDDVSTTSRSSTQTVMVEDSIHKISTFSSAHRRSHHVVSFDEKRNVFYTLDVLNDQECAARWYTDAECLRMKEENLMTPKALVVRDSGCGSDSYVDVLTQVYEHCKNSGSPSGDGKSEPLHFLPKELQAALQTQLQEWPTRTGLELRVVALGVKERTIRRLDLIEVVYNLPFDRTNLSTDQLRELLREKCQEISRTSRLFAHAIAAAAVSTVPKSL